MSSEYTYHGTVEVKDADYTDEFAIVTMGADSHGVWLRAIPHETAVIPAEDQSVAQAAVDHFAKYGGKYSRRRNSFYWRPDEWTPKLLASILQGDPPPQSVRPATAPTSRSQRTASKPKSKPVPKTQAQPEANNETQAILNALGAIQATLGETQKRLDALENGDASDDAPKSEPEDASEYKPPSNGRRTTRRAHTARSR